MLRKLWVLLGAGTLVVSWMTGCAGERPSGTAPPTGALSEPQVGLASASAPTVVVSSSPATPSTTRPPVADLSVASCNADTDCGWDDPCAPTRCAAQPVGGEVACEETGVAPGKCRCIAGGCNLEPNQPPPASGPCEKRGCALDRAGGRCIAGARSKSNSGMNPGYRVGPQCTCQEGAGGCTFEWHEPIPCKSVRDCWISDESRPRAIPRPAHLRGRDFKPCHDGEVPPQCNDAGYCVVATIGYSC